MATGSKDHRNRERDQARVETAHREALEEAGGLGQRARISTHDRVLELFTHNGIVIGTSQRIANLIGRTPEAVQPVLEELEVRGVVERSSSDVYVTARAARGSTHPPCGVTG